jgi:hypothetical protein
VRGERGEADTRRGDILYQHPIPLFARREFAVITLNIRIFTGGSPPFKSNTKSLSANAPCLYRVFTVSESRDINESGGSTVRALKQRHIVFVHMNFQRFHQMPSFHGNPIDERSCFITAFNISFLAYVFRAF